MMLGCPPKGSPPQPAGCTDVPSGLWCIRPERKCQSDRQGQGHRLRECRCGSPSPCHPGSTLELPATPLASVSSGFPFLRLAAPTGWAGAVTRDDAEEPGPHGNRAALPRSRDKLEPCFCGPSRPCPSPDPAAPELRLTLLPSRAAASPRPPSSLLPQRPLRLRRTASAACVRPSLLPIG